MKAFARRSAAALTGAMLVTAAVIAAAGEAASRWQCSTPGSAATAPAIAEAARDYLDRVEALYPSQVLGLVRAGERFYLVNSTDIEWGTRTRLALLALRLPEPYLTEEQRRTLSATPGPVNSTFSLPGQPPAPPGMSTAATRSHALDTRLGVSPGGSPPSGGFICLATARAGREGLGRTPTGEIVLAAGQSVHLVNPQDPEIAVEVRAAPDRSLNLGEIFQRSARAGIYAGLVGQSRQAGSGTTIERPDGTLTFRTASVGSSAVETRPAAPVTIAATEPSLPPVSIPEKVAVIEPPHEPVVPVQPDAARAIVAAAVAPVPPLERREQAAAIPAPSEQVTVAAPAASEPTPVVVEPVVPRPASVVALAPAPVVSAPAGRLPGVVPVNPVGTAAAQPYDDYANAMKTLMALKRSGSVRSVSEMTYVHPAVEILRQQR